MARAVITANAQRRDPYEPIYDIDPHTGASLEVFYADAVLARSFSAGCGWFWWTCQPGRLPEGHPSGPYPTSYAAYRGALVGSVGIPTCFGKAQRKWPG
jgi:hypothetical protein